MSVVCQVIYLILLASPTFCVPLSSVSDDPPVYRLPSTVIPSDYILNLLLDNNSFINNAFVGDVTITFAIEEGQTITEIKLHSKVANIKSVTLTKNEVTIPIEEGPYTSDPITDILTLHITEGELSGDSYVLTITYDGELSETSMSGFYKSTYQEGAATKYLASTQFESGDARLAFPCFDEPALKAQFTVKITYPNGYKVLSNTKQKGDPIPVDDLLSVEFEQTPKMSTYLLAFIVSEFSCTPDSIEAGLPTSVCSRNEVLSTANLAADVAPKILKIMRDVFTKHDYVNMNIGKMNLVAIPDFAAGAMENWGLVTYREVTLLYDEQDSSNQDQQKVATVVAHELSHQWFGDLVTLNWWDNTFLNEGFATYFEYHATAQIPEFQNWELPNQFVVDQVQTAFQADSSLSSLPLSTKVESPDEISNRFDDISYNKGGSVLRMVQHFLTLDNFVAGLTDYIEHYQYQNTIPENLWERLGVPAQDLLPKTLAEVMDSWTHNAGYPLLTVTSKNNDIIISQKRFLTDEGESDTKWYVPISYATSTDKLFNETTAKLWLTPDEDATISGILADSDWIVLNNQQTGYYRINYDDNLWTKILAALKKDETFGGIHELNRAQIVDDLLNFGRTGLKQYSEIFEILAYLTEEINYYPWYSAFKNFDVLLGNINSPALRASFSNHITTMLTKLYTSVPFDTQHEDDQIYTLKQVLALTWACKMGNADCISNSQSQFAAYKKSDSNKPNKNLRSVVYCNGLRYSIKPDDDWNFLWGKFGETDLSSEQNRILNALGCSTNPIILRNYLEKIITQESHIRIQDASAAFSSVYVNNPIGIDVMIHFIIDKHIEIVRYFDSTSKLKSLIASISTKLTNQGQINLLIEFAKTNGLEDDVKVATQEAIDKATSNLKLVDTIEKQLTTFFDYDSGSSRPVKAHSAIIFSIGIFIAFQLLLF